MFLLTLLSRLSYSNVIYLLLEMLTVCVNEMALKTLESKVRYRVARSNASVFTPKDFADLSGGPQVIRALNQLLAQERLIKLGYGLYAKSKKSSFTGATVPIKGLPELAREALTKLGAEVKPSKAEQDYNSGRTTQVPSGRVIGVQGRISRKIGYGGNNIIIERAT
jgi:hypothetical protein